MGTVRQPTLAVVPLPGFAPRGVPGIPPLVEGAAQLQQPQEAVLPVHGFPCWLM